MVGEIVTIKNIRQYVHERAVACINTVVENKNLLKKGTRVMQ